VVSGTLVETLLDALPQTQCTRCGYADCRGYAEAIAGGAIGINRCPPGGAEGIARLARLSGRPVVPLDPECGSEGPRALAVIDEAACIGCALCLKACPVDAIVGAAKQMHTVIDELCTGCELCVPVCPVDCIALVATGRAGTGWDAWSERAALTARARYAAHVARDRDGASADRREAAAPTAAARREAVAAALARARETRSRR
jgi:H+/Na+-translocating ferredoxin:NAD+ oxidoreductase subunit B